MIYRCLKLKMVYEKKTRLRPVDVETTRSNINNAARIINKPGARIKNFRWRQWMCREILLFYENQKENCEQNGWKFKSRNMVASQHSIEPMKNNGYFLLSKCSRLHIHLSLPHNQQFRFFRPNFTWPNWFFFHPAMVILKMDCVHGNSYVHVN